MADGGAEPLREQARPDAADPGAADTTTAGARRRRWMTLLAVAVGLAILGWLLHHAGLEPVWERVQALGWASPLILVPYALVTLGDALGWRFTLSAASRARVPFPSLTLSRMAGEAVNSMTPAAAVGGEPVKAYLLRPWHVGGAEAFASVVISKTALVASQSLFTALGIAALLLRLGRPRVALGWLIALIVVCLVFTAGLVWVQRRSPATALWRALHRLVPRAAFVARLETGATAFDVRLREFYRWEPRAFLLAASCHFAGWLIGVAEVVVIVVLTGGTVTWLDAFIIETLSQPIRASALVIPGSIGTQELGGVWLCTFLGMPEAEALTLWLLKRAREMFFDGIGLLYLARRTASVQALKGA
jgi:glycosyltransferase 2 family protein